MNPKDKTIKVLVDKILKRFASSDITVKDYWDADLCAIGFTDKNEKHLIYVSTYGRNENEYYVSLESPSLNENLSNEPKKEVFENINYIELEKIISEHLINRS